MGGVLGALNPVSSEKQAEIQRLIKTIIETFTPVYLQEYAKCLVIKARMDFEAAQEEAPLLSKWKPVDTEPVVEGYLTKEGANTKNWKKRYFVMHPNWVVEYYENEQQAHTEGAKPKGVMHLQGYKVHEDPGNHLLKKAKKTLKMFNMSDDMLPKQKEYPEFTFEVSHKRRRCWFIKAESQEEKDKWVKHFKNACYWARSVKEEWVGRQAFDRAIWRTRWRLGRYGWWSYGGTQEQVLSEMIVEHLNYAVLGEVYRSFSGAYMLRMKLRDAVDKMLDSSIGTAVRTAWSAIQNTIKTTVRPPIEAKLKEALTPLFECQNNIKTKIHDAIMSVIDPLLAQMVTPHMERLSNFLIEPITRGHNEAYARCREIFAEIAQQVERDGMPQGVPNPTRVLCAPFYRRTDYWVVLHSAWDQIETLREPLNLLGDLISHLSPWSVIWHIQKQLRKLIKHAVGSYEMELKELCKQNQAALTDKAAAKAACEQAAERTMARMTYDGTGDIHYCVKYVAERILMPPFERKVIPSITDLVKPIADLVPEPLKILVDIEQMTDEVLTNLVTSCIGRPLEHYLPPIPTRPELPQLPHGYEGDKGVSN